MTETGRDDVFADDITFPAPDSATAVPRKICKGFARYLWPKRTRPSFLASVIEAWRTLTGTGDRASEPDIRNGRLKCRKE